jgi:hypothetical protein
MYQELWFSESCPSSTTSSSGSGSSSNSYRAREEAIVKHAKQIVDVLSNTAASKDWFVAMVREVRRRCKMLHRATNRLVTLIQVIDACHDRQLLAKEAGSKNGKVYKVCVRLCSCLVETVVNMEETAGNLNTDRAVMVC